MHGILLLSTIDYIKTYYNHNIVSKISDIANFNVDSDMIYEDKYLDMISEVNDNKFYERIGSYLVKYIQMSSNAAVFFTHWTGYKDFLYGLEKFNEYMKIYFPSNDMPLFRVLDDSDERIHLECCSLDERTIKFSIGLICEVGILIYKKDVHLSLMENKSDGKVIKALMKLSFNNISQVPANFCSHKYIFPLEPKLLEQIFPYSIVVSMKVVSMGVSLLRTYPEAKGRHLSDVVIVERPNIAIHHTGVLKYCGKMFVLLMKCIPISQIPDKAFLQRKRVLHSSETIDGVHYLRLKGKIMFIKSWNMFIFLGTPVLMSLSSLYSAGINICHLSIHDFSRDMMLAEAQQTVELKMTFDQGIEKQNKMECFLQMLDEEMKRTNVILNEMIPGISVLKFHHDVTQRMKLLENVTVLISDIVKFTSACSLMKPMEVVTTLNTMYSQFDYLTAKHGAYKVETIGDAYMIMSTISGSSPQIVCDVALDMREAIKNIKEPKTGSHLKIRIGIHTGSVIAGIVGLKVPKFCLFGSTVKMALLLEASSLPMKIKISQTTKEFLTHQYSVTKCESVQTFKKEILKTYWLNGKDREATNETRF